MEGKGMNYQDDGSACRQATSKEPLANDLISRRKMDESYQPTKPKVDDPAMTQVISETHSMIMETELCLKDLLAKIIGDPIEKEGLSACADGLQGGVSLLRDQARKAMNLATKINTLI